MPLVPHSDELGALARAPAGTIRALAGWFGLAHFAPTSDVHGSASEHRRRGSSHCVGYQCSARGGARCNPNTQGDSTLARFRDEDLYTLNVYHLVSSDDSHRQRASTLT